MEFIGYLSSLIMGIVLGLTGGGGSILTVPILVYLFSFSPTVAVGYSLFLVGISALVGGLLYLRKNEVDIKVGFSFVLPSMVGVSISRSVLLPNLPEVVLQTALLTLTKEILVMATFAGLMIVASYAMIKKRPARQPLKAGLMKTILVFAWQGLIVGLVAGFVGAGGGFLIIPALVLVTGLSMRVAVGTSLMIIALQSLFGFAVDLSQGTSADWNFLLLLGALAITGIIIGSATAGQIKEQSLKTIFGWFVLVMGTAIFFEQINRVLTK